MIRKLIRGAWLVVLLAGCTNGAPAPSDCVEFNRHTFYQGKPTTCTMLWCERRGFASYSSGLASQWCIVEGTGESVGR